MGVMNGRVAIVTGAGRGLGREHALLLADEGAKVVVNDLGGVTAGSELSAAEEVVAEIRARGGQAVVNGDDVATWDGARALVQAAVDEYGQLDALVNNAGILRDGFLVGMSEEDWDAVVAVHLKGHFAPLRFAAEHWKARAKAGEPVDAAVVNTSSAAGLYGNPGQANYASAKGGIATLTLVAAAELGRYGVRVNAIAPVARTRLTVDVPGIGELLKAPEGDAFDLFDPANVAPLVAYLVSPGCDVTGQVYAIHGGKVARFASWEVAETFDAGRRLELDELAEIIPSLGRREAPAQLF